MLDHDFDGFNEMLGDVAMVYGRALNEKQTAMYFRVLDAYPLTVVRAALDAHARDSERGRFMPLPADLIAQIERIVSASDGRPMPEEAWATALDAADERATVVWTTETAEAWWSVAEPLMSVGDRFSASRGFMDKYQRLVSDARKRGEAVTWRITQGTDKDLRYQALESGVRSGRISRELARQLLPRHQDAGPIVAAIAGKVVPLLGNKRPVDPGRAAEVQAAANRLSKLAEKLRAESPPADHRPTADHGRQVVMHAVEAGLLTSVSEIDEWMTRAGNREDVSELQVRMLEVRRHA